MLCHVCVHARVFVSGRECADGEGPLTQSSAGYSALDVAAAEEDEGLLLDIGTGGVSLGLSK